MFKIRILLVIIFIATVITGYFITQPMIQAQDAPAYGTITGNVYYSGIDCQYSTGDHVIVYKLTAGGAVWVTEKAVQYYKNYYYVVTGDDLENQAGYYRLVPNLQTASGNIGVSPHVRDSVWWQPGMIKQNQNFTADACNHP